MTGLKRKVAGIPMGVWLIAGLALGIAFFIMQRRNRAQAVQAGPVGFTSTGPTPIYPDQTPVIPGADQSALYPTDTGNGAVIPNPNYIGPPIKGGGGGNHRGGNGGGGGPTSTGNTGTLPPKGGGRPSGWVTTAQLRAQAPAIASGWNVTTSDVLGRGVSPIAGWNPGTPGGPQGV